MPNSVHCDLLSLTGSFQEAFKAIEEIHNLLELSGKAPKPGLLDNYYSRQAKVYWMANNRLFHAAALHKLFVLWKEQKKCVSQEELQRFVREGGGGRWGKVECWQVMVVSFD